MFKIGDRVRCRDFGPHWEEGTVTHIDPEVQVFLDMLSDMPDSDSYHYKYIQKLGDNDNIQIVETKKTNGKKLKRQIPSSRSTSSSSSNSNSKRQKNSLSSTKNSTTDGQRFERLERILVNSTPNPSGPSEQENVLMARVTEFNITRGGARVQLITPYRYEVELGNGVCDCVGYDMDNKLCIVEAKCIHKQKNRGKRRKNLREQTNAYATFLAQQTHADVVAYCFDDEGGELALERIGVYEYEIVKNNDPRKKS